jgi:hypothetical protein
MAGTSASGPDLEDFASRLKTLARSRETLDVAQLQFVGLADIKQAYGDRWPAQKGRIQDIAEAFLRKRIGSSDLLIRGDGGFVVLFGASRGAESHAISAQLTHGLNSFFTGADVGQLTPSFGGAVRSIAAADLDSTFGDLAVMASSGEGESSDGPGMTGLEWRFEPVWDVKREMLSYWYVSPFSTASETRVAGYHFENAATHPARFVALDEAGLWMAEQALQELLSADRQTLVGSSVHITTLANLASRTRIFATLDRLDPALNRFRLLKVAGVAPGFPRLYLNEIMSALKSRLHNVMIGAAWDEPDISGLVQSAPIAIGLSVPPSAVTSGPIVAMPTLTARIAEAVKDAHAGRVRLFVEGAVAKYLALKFARIGVDNIASHMIWPARPMAEGIVKWPASRLIAA